jgi:hypothetical protein
VSYILAIYDYDMDYSNHLMDYMKRRQKRITQVHVFTNLNSLTDYLLNYKIDLLLLGENHSMEEVNVSNIKNTCILSEGNYVKERGDLPVIYKFQSAERILEEIFSYYPIDIPIGGTAAFSNSRMKIISIFSVGRGTEQSVFSLAEAQQYGIGKKTLYINLCIYQTFPEILSRPDKKGLSDLIYYLKQNPNNLIIKMNNLIIKTGSFDYIPGVVFGPELFEITGEDISKWVNEIKNVVAYDVVIFNVGNFMPAVFELFRESSQIQIILGEDAWEQEKYNNLKDQLHFAGYDDILQKVKQVIIPDEDQEQIRNCTMNDILNEQLGQLVQPYIEEEEI